MRYLTTLTFILFQLVSNGQTNIVSKKLINLSQIPYWKNISKNDTLIDNYSYLDSLNFYFIKYRSDSLIINGFTIEPKYGVNFPIVILNRGGNREFGAWTVGSLIEWGSPIARAGYIIIASQYRGNSGSMGKDEFGGKDVNDVLNLIPIVKEIPQSDTSRIGMYGWSRGGLMTYIALTKTTKIKTAIIGGTPTDLIEELERRPEMEKVYEELIPNYSTNKSIELIERSAIFWTNKLCKTTSYLILHGKSDLRVDFSQAVKIEKKLKANHLKTNIKIFDGADHVLSQNKIEKNRIILEWLKQNL
jgi:dipeptidyl aminopeptidase/acylaminoacyl peptidase